MNMDIKELKSRLDGLNRQIKNILQDSGFADYHDMEGVDYDNDSSEDQLLVTELYHVLDNLGTASYKLDYLNRRITTEGVLHKNNRDRYEIAGRELTSGVRVEVLLRDLWDDKSRWVLSSIEHNGDDYYLVGYKDVKLEGCRCRVRR